MRDIYLGMYKLLVVWSAWPVDIGEQLTCVHHLVSDLFQPAKKDLIELFTAGVTPTPCSE